MGALPSSQPAGIRYAAYIDELHEFFATSRIPYGSPTDLPAFIANLHQPGTFADDLSSLIRSFVLRQGGSMPHAELLEILSLAVGGPEVALHPQQFGDSLRQLLSFIAGVQRRPWNVPPNAPGEVVPFPAELPAPSRSDPKSASVPMTKAAPPRSTGKRRAGLWVALSAVAGLAVAGVLFARMHSLSETEVFHVQPAPRAASQQNSAPEALNMPRTAQTPTPPAPIEAIDQSLIGQSSAADARPAKPSAYGETLSPRSSRRVQSRWTDGQSGQGSSPVARGTASVPPQPAAGNPSAAAANSASTTVFAPYNPTDGATQPPAPIVRQPAHRDPDSYIAGDMPAGGTPSASPSYFTVSSGVMAANLISSPDPVYPLLARLAHVQGQVTLLAVVAKDGTVEATRVLRGNHLLRSAAEDAVRQFRYRPYRIDGRAVDVATVVTVDFHDQADPPQQ